jgi:nitric oxide reductase subunit B
MGATYYMIPEESKRELYSKKLAYIQLAALVLVGVTALVTIFINGMGITIDNPWFNFNQGRPLLEIPRWLDLLVVVGALIFLFNVGMTILKGEHWTVTQAMLLTGLITLSLLYLFGIPVYENETIDWYYWWWVIHLWVEGAWELVVASLTAFALIKLTGVNKEVVEKWLYIEIGLFLFTGIAGTGHHYYWLGAPRYWLYVGGVFSALEPLPILLMVIDVFKWTRERKMELVNPLAWTYMGGGALYHFIGAGIWGFMHTLPQINYYTHGSQVTVAHGHLAFFGAYALFNLMFFYFAIPEIKGYRIYDDSRGKLGFWIMIFSMTGIGLAFSGAGILQTYLERVLGLGYMTAQAQMQFWFKAVIGIGIVFFIGVLRTVTDLLTLRPKM